jgi:N-acetylglucosamine kinase-like BadF-type ATPase
VNARPAAAVLAIDGGNSKTDVALVAADGTLLATVRGGPSNHQVIGSERATKELTSLVSSAAGLAGLPADGPVARHTSACLAGADLPVEEADLSRLVQSLGWSATSAVVNDTFAVLRAGLSDNGPHWGIGVVCGAGINCVGVAPDGRTTRFLALGELSGDWGGGGELGPQALWYAMRAEDGRGPETELRTAVPAHYGLARVEDVVVGMHLGTIEYSARYGLVPVLFAVAGRGDKVARDVVLRQATEICLMATVAARRLDLCATRGVPIVLGGSLMTARDPLLSHAISDQLAGAIPGAEIHVVDVPPVVGAALLGLDHVGASPAAAARLRECARATW